MNRKIVVGAIALVLLAGAPAAWAGDGIQTAGSVVNGALIAAAAAATIGHHDGAGAKQLAVSLGVTWGVTFALKRAINETRPNGGDYSFPSGHSSSSFASAEFMRRRYGWRWGAPAYALAAFVAYSRVESRMHYTHDVVAGAAIGIASSLIFVKPHPNWTATVSGDTRGAQLTFSRVW
jgi:membrane-associated phospholipid phosphatase